MAKYQCSICGYIYDEEKMGVPWDELDSSWTCPVCTAPREVYERVGAPAEPVPAPAAPEQPTGLEYPSAYETRLDRKSVS